MSRSTNNFSISNESTINKSQTKNNNLFKASSKSSDIKFKKLNDDLIITKTPTTTKKCIKENNISNS
jgi:hypothetical protein